MKTLTYGMEVEGAYCAPCWERIFWPKGTDGSVPYISYFCPKTQEPFDWQEREIRSNPHSSLAVLLRQAARQWPCGTDGGAQCGVHLHIGGLTAQQIAAVCERQAEVLEAAKLAVTPEIGQKIDYRLNRGWARKTPFEQHLREGSRYVAFNATQAWREHRTLELRFFPATYEPGEILPGVKASVAKIKEVLKEEALKAERKGEIILCV